MTKPTKVSLIAIGLGRVNMSLGQPSNPPSHPHDNVGNWLWDGGGCILWDNGGVIAL